MFSGLKRAVSAIMPKRSAPGPLDEYWYRPVGAASYSGIDVTPDKAMAVSAVNGCVRILRESLSSLPFRVFERTAPRTSEYAIEYYLWRVLHDAPNRWQTPMEWLEMGITHLCLRGNYYCAIVGSGTDNMELWPLNPDRMGVEQKSNGFLKYTYKRKDNIEIVYKQEDILHIRGMSFNGVTGVSVLEYARNSVGSSISQETHGASLFKNGGLPAFWISRPGARKWTDTARKNFRTGWRKMHGGAENAGNPPILEDDMRLESISLSNRDSQWIESRGFTDADIARFFGVWPEMIGVESKIAAATAQERSKLFVDYTLRPLAVRIQQTCNRCLIDDTKKYYTRIALDELRRANVKEQAEADNIGIQGGSLLINEVREMNDRNPVEGGDIPRFPTNMQPAGGGPDRNEQGGQPGKGQPKPPRQKLRNDEAARQKQKTRESFAILLDDAAAKITASEIKKLGIRADHAAEDREKWREWATGVYVVQQDYATKTLAPICAAWLEINGVSYTGEQLAAELYEIDGISAVFDLDADIPALLESWRETAAVKVGDFLKERFFNHA